MTKASRLLSFFIVPIFICGGNATAQPISANDSKPPHESAVADARQRLARQIGRIPVAETQLDRLLPVESLESISAAARVIGQPITYTDGTTEVHVVLDLKTLNESVEAALQRAGRAEELESVRIGLAAPGVVDRLMASGFSSSRAPTTSAPREGKLRDLTVEAAMLDARRQIVNRLREVRLSDRRRVEDLFEEQPAAESAVLRALPFAMFGSAKFERDGRCSVSARIRAGDALAVVQQCLREIIDRYGNLAAATPDEALTAEGIGPVPSAALLGRLGVAAPITPDAAGEPDWAFACMTTTGEAKSNREGDSPSAGAMAAAEFDARRRIAERIDRLTTPSGRTMSDILLGGAVSKMDIQRFMQGAVRVGRAEVDSDGLMRVTLRIPLRGLWRLVRHADDAPDKRG